MRQSAAQRIHQTVFYKSGNSIKLAALPLGDVSRITGKQFIAAIAGEHHLDVLARERRHEVQRHARRVRDRLVLVPDEARERAEEELQRFPEVEEFLSFLDRSDRGLVI